MDKTTKSTLVIVLITFTAVVIYILVPDLYSTLGNYLSSFISNTAHAIGRFLTEDFIPFAFECMLYIFIAIVCLFIVGTFYYENNK